jgi:tetrahydromethanopterin S-methyltransferase subunit G
MMADLSKGDAEEIVDKAVDPFAEMVGKGFNEVHQRFNEVNARLDGHDRRFDQFEKDMAEVKYLLTDVVRRDEFLDGKKRLEVLEARAK